MRRAPYLGQPRQPRILTRSDVRRQVAQDLGGIPVDAFLGPKFAHGFVMCDVALDHRGQAGGLLPIVGVFEQQLSTREADDNERSRDNTRRDISAQLGVEGQEPQPIGGSETGK